MSKRVLVIGDIHGAYKALLQVLERSNYNSENDILITLGDYVDGWPESYEVIDHLIKLKSKGLVINIKGNHDEWARNWLNTGVRHPIWVEQGGKSTIESYINNPGSLASDDHRDFFNSLNNYYLDSENRGFVHGGFVSKNGLGHEVYESTYYWDRDLWGIAVVYDKIKDPSPEALPYLDRFNRHKEVYIGHTPTDNWEIKPHYKEYLDPNQPKNGKITIPMNRCNIWNMDTGAGYLGKLTIMDIDSKEYWQSDPVKDLYPNNLGRT